MVNKYLRELDVRMKEGYVMQDVCNAIDTALEDMRGES